MVDFFMDVGDEVVVSVFKNGESAGAVIHNRLTKHGIATDLYVQDEKMLLQLFEILGTTLEAVRFHVEKPNIKKLVAKRIKELEDEIAREGSKPPSPADDIEDIPF